MIADEILDLEILGLTSDSRQVRPGFLFAALPGINIDGREFIDDAIGAGASAILTSEDFMKGSTGSSSFNLITDPNPRQRYAKIAGQFYKTQPKNIVAVTGTNGKSSVAEFTRQIWQHSNKNGASLGTLGLVEQDRSRTGHLTTPEPTDLHKMLQELANKNTHHVVVEASSHGLDQFRLDGVKIKIAAITNLSRDHLDYHRTIEKYYDGKFRLFSEVLDQDGMAVINADDKMVNNITSILRDRKVKFLDFGAKANDIRLNKVEVLSDGQRLYVNVFGREVELNLPLIGKFQSMNALCALAIVLADGLDLDKAISGLETLVGVRGRLELASYSPSGARIFVDYAHTPDALLNVLEVLRTHTDKKLNIVFGCGGNRDQGKRIEMGKIATRLADDVFVTDDNPRHEDAAAIRSQIISVSPDAIEIADRMEAIKVAIKGLSEGDLLVIAGKGHEQGQIIGNKVLPFDDVSAVNRIVNDEE